MKRPRLLHHRHGRVHVAPRPQDLAVQDEPVLVLQHAHRHARLHRPACLALGDPARVRPEDRKHVLLVRNRLARQQTPPDLVHLAPRVLRIPPYRRPFRLRNPFRHQRIGRGPDTPGQRCATRQIRLHTLRTTLRPARRARPVEQCPHTPRHVTPPAPAAHPVPLGQPGRGTPKDVGM